MVIIDKCQDCSYYHYHKRVELCRHPSRETVYMYAKYISIGNRAGKTLIPYWCPLRNIKHNKDEGH